MKSTGYWLLGSVVLAAAGASSAAHADNDIVPYAPTIGPYIGGNVGAGWFNDVTLNGPGAERKLQFEAGPQGALVAGFGFGNGFRAELEGGYRRSDVRSQRFGDGAFGALGVWTLMANVLYDIDLTQWDINAGGFTPHLGIGGGWARARFSDVGPYAGDHVLSGQEDLLAYQGIAGVDYALSPSVKVSIDYRYFGTGIGHYAYSTRPSDGADGRSATSLSEQSVLIGMRYEFETAEPSAPPPAARPAPPPPPATPEPEARRSFQVFFDFDRSTLTSEAKSVVQQAARIATSGQHVHLQVTGHTDTVGTGAYNQALSERRATAVRDELVADGVPADEIAAQGVGKADLLVPTADGIREARNRRATIDVDTPHSSPSI